MVVQSIGKASHQCQIEGAFKFDFDLTSAFPYDDHVLSWNVENRTVSIWTVACRLRIPFVAGERQLAMLQYRKGESDLILKNGEFYLSATCDVPEIPKSEVDDFLGVDLGVVNTASDSDGKHYPDPRVKIIRQKKRKLLRSLKRACTRSANRKAKRVRGKLSRFTRDVDHCISKEIVHLAKRTGRGVAIEDLKGICERVTARGQLSKYTFGWSYRRLRFFLEYKARMTGVPLEVVSAFNTSRECSKCGCTDKRNRVGRSEFRCLECGFTGDADHNAALNIRSRAMAVANRPNVPERPIEVGALGATTS